MKNFVILTIFIASLITVSSCSDNSDLDSDNNYPIVLTYTNKIEVVDFKLYVGSQEGGREISKEYSHPEEIWGKRMTLYPPSSIVFASDNLIGHYYDNKLGDTYNYRIQGDTILRDNLGWELYGIGNKQRLSLAVAFFRALKITEYSSSGGSAQELGEYSDETFFQEGNLFSSLADMTNVMDTLVWCNVRYVYERKK